MKFEERMYTLVQGQSRVRHNGKESVFHLWIKDDTGITVVSHIENKLLTHRAEELEIV